MVLTPLERNKIINSAYNYAPTGSNKKNIGACGSTNANFNSNIATVYSSSLYTYDGFGIGSGINSIRNNAHSFFFSDGNYVVTNNVTHPNTDIMTLPVGLDALAFVYNLDFVASFTAKGGDFTFIDNKWQYNPGNGTNTGDDRVNNNVDTLCNNELKVNPLKITPRIINDIYKGSIINWNDPKIVNKNIDINAIPVTIPNSSVENPNQTAIGYIPFFTLLLIDDNNQCLIKPVYRSTGAIVNQVLTRYLNQVEDLTIIENTTMTTAFGGTNPTGFGVSFQQGVEDYLKNTKNSFGYIYNSACYSGTNPVFSLPPARLKNQAGQFVTLNAISVTKQFLNQYRTGGVYRSNSIAYNSIDYSRFIPGGYPLIGIQSIFFYPGKSSISSKNLDVVCFLIYLTQLAKFARVTNPQTGNTLTDIKLGQDQVNLSNIYSFPSYYAQQILEKILLEFPGEKTTLLA